MTTGGPGAQRQSKNERRDVAREKAREARLRQQRRERRNRLLLQGGIGLAVLAAVAIIALVLVNSVRPPGPGPKNMADGGIVITKGLTVEPTVALTSGGTPKQRAPQSGKVAIRLYEDFQCPVCKQFEDANAAQIKNLVQQGEATLQIYPVAFLDSSSLGNKYSTRAANAAACVANESPDAFYEFHRLLYANQPPEANTPGVPNAGKGMTDDQLIGYVKQAKATNLSTISNCIRSHTYFNFVGAATDRFLKGNLPASNVKKVQGTPTILVNGKQYNGAVNDAKAFSSFLLSTGAAFSSAPTATPTASAQPKSTPTPSKSK